MTTPPAPSLQERESREAFVGALQALFDEKWPRTPKANRLAAEQEWDSMGFTARLWLDARRTLPPQPVVPEALAKLRRLAMAATPGPWEWWTSNSTIRLTGADGRDGGVLDVAGTLLCSPQNRAYIAAANPATSLALLDALAAATSPVTPPTTAFKPVEDPKELQED